ncbi:hypothetical protein SHEWT2_00908 [Shewanella hafniensis]|jgi:hypothetical protein|nr:hypothetical protein [Shewanella putrefaciens]CAD6366242.1 hypothetical protein SHEWT2_00908 [Shewanella hafniensis]
MMQDARIRKDGAGSTIIAGWLNREPEGVILGSHPFFLVNWPSLVNTLGNDVIWIWQY